MTSLSNCLDRDSQAAYWAEKGRRRSAAKTAAAAKTTLLGLWEGPNLSSPPGTWTPTEREARVRVWQQQMKALEAKGDLTLAGWTGEVLDEAGLVVGYTTREARMRAITRLINFEGFTRDELKGKVPPLLNVEEVAKVEADATLLDRVFTARDLGKKKFKPIQWLVPDLLPEGVGMFPGAPKSGKSFIMLDLALACATGGDAFGVISVTQRPVLYLALEDGQRRLQSRCESLGYELDNLPSNLHLVTEAKPEEVLPLVKAWVNRHRNGLVLVDILALATPGTPKRGESEYMFYYGVLGEYKKIAHEHPGCGIVIAHHTKKAGKAGSENADFIENALGSTALSGAVDYNLTLAFQRGSSEGKLMKTGKDGADYTVALRRQASGAWHLNGDSFEEAQGAVALLSPTGRGTSLSDKTLTILQMAQQGPVTTESVANELGISRNDAGGRLRRLREMNRLRSSANGSYVLVTEGEAG